MPEPVAQTSKPLPHLIAAGAIVLGTLLWFVVVNHPARPVRFWIAAAACGLPACFRASRATIERVATLVGRAPRWLIPLCVFAIAWAALYAEAIYDGRRFAPGWHDEYSYLFQTQTFASGRLWLPALPAEIRDAFDTFYILVAPKYASQYFPGTALALLPGLLLCIPAAMTSLTLCATAASLAFIAARQIANSTSVAILVAVGVVCASPTRFVSVVAISQPPTMALAALAYVAFFAAMRRPMRRWLAVLGLASGWLLVTRPIDAIALLGPIWGVALWKLLTRHHADERNPHSRLTSLAALVGPAVPFIGLQLIINVGVTGSATLTPFELYARRDMKGADWTLLRDATWGEPESVVPQKHTSYAEWTSTSFARRSDRVADLIGESKFHARRLVSDPTVLVVAPLGIACMLLAPSLRRTVLPVAIGLPLWFALYVGYPALRVHYMAAAVPVSAVIAGTGFIAFRYQFGPNAARPVAAMAIVWSAMSLPAFDRSSVELYPKSPVSERLAQLEATLPTGRAIVFVPVPDRDMSADDEPVFNWRAATLEDNQIIRAHDLTPATTGAVIRYFAEVQPDRVAFGYDRTTGQLNRWGTCAELVQKGKAGFLKDR
jgi:hypothetical protein